MAKKNSHEGEEPVGWVTIKGVHFPKWADGSIGWQDGEEKSSTENTKKPNLEDIQSYGFDPRDVTGDPTIVKLDDGDYYKTGENKWNKHSSSGRVFSGSISDKQMSDKVANSKNVEVLPSAKTNAKTSKKATMDLGNGLRLTADVSDPYKNYSEVERAKKLNREKQYANKKLYQHQKAAKEEKEKAQAIADIISAKTGIPTTSRNARYDTSRATSKPIPKSQVSVSNAQFVRAYGKNPSGKGNWAFFLAGSDEPLFFYGSFSEAKKKAIEEAAKRGVSKITVGS